MLFRVFAAACRGLIGRHSRQVIRAACRREEKAGRRFFWVACPGSSDVMILPVA